MAVFSTLKNFNVFVDGYSQAGKCTVTMPNIQTRTAEYNAGGMDGPLNIDLGIQVLQFSFTMHEYDPNVLGMWGIGDTQNRAFTFRGAQESMTGQVVPVLLEARGWLSALNMGSWDAGTIPDVECTIDARYIRLEVNGTTVYEIDPANMIRMVNGVDVLSEQRRALGISGTSGV